MDWIDSNNLNYKLPNRKKWLLTDEFLSTFKKELDKVFDIHEKIDKPNYWNTYQFLESTRGFYKALNITSKKHNVSKAIYEYACNLPWYHSDIFDSRLTEMMHERGVIEEGSVDEINNLVSEEELVAMEKSGAIEWIEDVTQYDGYSITKRYWTYVDLFS